MQNRKVVFENQNAQTLSGILDLPAAEPVGYALFAHCFTCSKNLKAATNIARALNDARIGVLRFDFTGLGQSEGEFADTNFSSNVDDLLAAAKSLRGLSFALWRELDGVLNVAETQRTVFDLLQPVSKLPINTRCQVWPSFSTRFRKMRCLPTSPRPAAKFSARARSGKDARWT